jgi:hypothetical protein
MWEFLEQHIFPHWPFIVFCLTAALVVQVFKGAVWTKARGDGKGVKAGFFWWMRKTLPLHPVAAGALFGLIPGLPTSPGIPETMASSALYYGAAGLVSTWAFDIIRGIAKKRGYDIHIPGEKPTPPPKE